MYINTNAGDVVAGDSEVDPYEAVTEDDTDGESDPSLVLAADASAQTTPHRSLHISSMVANPTENIIVPESNMMDVDTQP